MTSSRDLGRSLPLGFAFSPERSSTAGTNSIPSRCCRSAIISPPCSHCRGNSTDPLSCEAVVTAAFRGGPIEFAALIFELAKSARSKESVDPNAAGLVYLLLFHCPLSETDREKRVDLVPVAQISPSLVVFIPFRHAKKTTREGLI